MNFIVAICFCSIMIIIAAIGAIISRKDTSDGKINSSKELHDEMNKERKERGENIIESINTIGGISTNNLARKDKSWSSVPDFFIKLFSKK